MARLARGAGLLLHEAIDFGFMEELYGAQADETSRASLDHHRKSHTSVADAGRIASEAGVRRLALHHLVPGTDRRSAWDDVREHYDGEFLVPDDLDVISIAHV